MISQSALSSPVILSIDKQSLEQRRTAITLKLSLTLLDGSKLYVRENHILANGWVDYAYQWQTANQQLIHRWDNAHDFPAIDTSPYHQHIGSEENVHPSEPMTLEKVLTFIASRLS